jgi:pre-mRNA 3'-end-processing factor FIP1
MEEEDDDLYGPSETVADTTKKELKEESDGEQGDEPMDEGLESGEEEEEDSDSVSLRSLGLRICNCKLTPPRTSKSSSTSLNLPQSPLRKFRLSSSKLQTDHIAQARSPRIQGHKDRSTPLTNRDSCAETSRCRGITRLRP